MLTTNIIWGADVNFRSSEITNLPPNTTAVKFRFRIKHVAVAYVKTQNEAMTFYLEKDGVNMKLGTCIAVNGKRKPPQQS